MACRSFLEMLANHKTGDNPPNRLNSSYDLLSTLPRPRRFLSDFLCIVAVQFTRCWLAQLYNPRVRLAMPAAHLGERRRYGFLQTAHREGGADS